MFRSTVVFKVLSPPPLWIWKISSRFKMHYLLGVGFFFWSFSSIVLHVWLSTGITSGWHDFLWCNFRLPWDADCSHFVGHCLPGSLCLQPSGFHVPPHWLAHLISGAPQVLVNLVHLELSLNLDLLFCDFVLSIRLNKMELTLILAWFLIWIFFLGVIMNFWQA